MTGPGPSWLQRQGLALLTDYYELTMCAGYLTEGRAEQQVCFEYFFRALPPHAGFAVVEAEEDRLASFDAGGQLARL